MPDTDETISAACCATFDPTLDRAAQIVMAYVGRNAVPAGELPALIASVHGALVCLTRGTAPTAEVEIAKPSPAEIRKSITPDGIVSFLDGRSYKTLRRHLGVHGLTPEGYRARFGLPADYPIVSANYSAQRSALAKNIGLGRGGQSANTLAA